MSIPRASLMPRYLANARRVVSGKTPLAAKVAQSVPAVPATTRPQTPWGSAIASAMATQQQERFAEAVTFQAAGVTFPSTRRAGYRQETIAQLKDGDPVMLVREPDNEHDASAVLVLGAQGDLGYVPRHTTSAFDHAITPGFVVSTGRPVAQPDVLGATIVAMPALRAAYMDALPDHLVRACDLSASLPPDMWRALEHDQLERSMRLCQVTGLSDLELPQLQEQRQDQPLQVAGVRAHERWRVDHRSRTIVLEGLLTVCMPVHMLLHWLNLQDMSQEASTSDRQSSCLDQLDELSGVYRENALDVAQLAGRDALRFTNSMYASGDVTRPVLQEGRSWSLQDVQDYATQLWYTKTNDMVDYKLDVSWLLDQKVDGQPIVWADLPDELVKHTDMTPY